MGSFRAVIRHTTERHTMRRDGNFFGVLSGVVMFVFYGSGYRWSLVSLFWIMSFVICYYLLWYSELWLGLQAIICCGVLDYGSGYRRLFVVVFWIMALVIGDYRLWYSGLWLWL